MDIKTLNNLPVYQAMLADQEDGIWSISLVSDPAVLVGYEAFANEKEYETFKVSDESKHMVTGPVMRADFPIFRKSEKLGNYYITYSRETIEKMAEKLMADGHQNAVNIEHQDVWADNTHMVECFIKDTSKGIDPKGFEDVENGSLFATFKVNDIEVWNDIQEGKYKGFSLEGLFSMEIIKMEEQKMSEIETIDDNEVNEIIDLINKVKNKYSNE